MELDEDAQNDLDDCYFENEDDLVINSHRKKKSRARRTSNLGKTRFAGKTIYPSPCTTTTPVTSSAIAWEEILPRLTPTRPKTQDQGDKPRPKE